MFAKKLLEYCDRISVTQLEILEGHLIEYQACGVRSYCHIASPPEGFAF